MFENISMKNVLIVLAIVAAIVYYIYTPKRINVPQPIYRAPVGPAQPVPVRTVAPPQAPPANLAARAQIVTPPSTPSVQPPIIEQPVQIPPQPQMPQQMPMQEQPQSTSSPMIPQPSSENPDNSLPRSQYVKQHLKRSMQNTIINSIAGGRV